MLAESDDPDLTTEQYRQIAAKYERLFGAAYSALLRIADERIPQDTREAAIDAIAIIGRYPDDEYFS